MAEQPKYEPLEPSGFFPDGQSARPIPAGTVARGLLRADPHLYTGRRGAATGAPEPDYAETFPFVVTRDVLARGRGRYLIFCAICHDPLGTGNGKIVERGYVRPPSYHTERLRRAPVGHYFSVITNGYGAMPDHATLIPPRDRWAIIAYIRALQLSQHAPLEELPDGVRRAALEVLEGQAADGTRAAR